MPGVIDLMCIQIAKGSDQASRLLESLVSVFFIVKIATLVACPAEYYRAGYARSAGEKLF
jgi:hypothetical protein